MFRGIVNSHRIILKEKRNKNIFLSSVLLLILIILAIGCSHNNKRGTKLENSSSSSNLLVRLLSGSPAMPGKPAPDAELTDLNGKKAHLKEALGKQTTILLFSSTTCPFSTEEHDEIQKVKKKFGKRVNLVTILVNETSDSAHSYLRANQVPGIVLLDTQDNGVNAYGIKLVPTVLLVNSKGSVDYFGHFTPADDMINTVLKSWRGERTYASRRVGGG